MILKKPYAFLIKYFRIIHLILAVPMIYLAYKSTNIVGFFSDYVENNYSVTINGELAPVFINALMYLAIILIILAVIAVYWLFKYKEKPRKHYIAIIIYYLLLFVLIGVSHNILNVMEAEAIEASIARTYRDISLLFVMPQFYFCIFILLRGLGFNIKKLNFADDLRELEISEKDSEEFEFVVGIEGYKAKRTFRRFIREFSYYIKENTFIFIAIIFLIVIGVGTSIYIHREDYEINYKQGDSFNYQGFSVNVEDSIVTNLSYNGKIVSKDKYYLVIKLKLKNNLMQGTKLNHTDFRIVLNKEFLYPVIEKSSYFADYATPYTGKEIEPAKDNTYLLAYELKKEEIKDNYELKIYNGIKTDKKELRTRYFNIKLTPLLLEHKSNVKTVNLKEKLDLSNSNIGNTNITINSYQVTNKYVYKYERCYIDECKNYTDFVGIDYSSSGLGSTLLVLDYKIKLDKSSSITQSEKSFFNNFISIRYKSGENSSVITALNKTPTNLKNSLVLQTSDQIKNAEEFEVLFTIRNKIYSVKLK